jgi:hypothetical protein
MKVYYEESDLVSFGEYLLSQERTKLIKENESGIPLEKRLEDVSHADLENWKEKQKTI